MPQTKERRPRPESGAHQITPPPSIAAAAVSAAERGWYVHPLLYRDKRPAVSGWPQVASCDPARVARWPWHRHNYGIACGPSGLVGLDLDPPDGIRHLDDLRAGRELPATYRVRTPRGGLHLIFAAIPGRETRTSTKRVAPDIDIRAVGGMLVGAGSILDPRAYPGDPVAAARVRGGRAYVLLDGRDPVPLPGWLADEIDTATRHPVTMPRPAAPLRSPGAYGAKALAEELATVAAARAGRRNDQLNKSGFALYQLAGGGLLDPETVTAGLWEAADACGLVRDDAAGVGRTIESARRAGLAKPRGRAS